MNTLEKEKAVDLLNKILNETLSDSLEIAIHEELNRLLPDPHWSDYIFWSDDYLNANGSINFDRFFDKVMSYRYTDEYIRNSRVIALVDKLLKRDFSELSELEIVNEINELSFEPNWANYVFVEKSCFNEDGTINKEALIRQFF